MQLLLGLSEAALPRFDNFVVGRNAAAVQSLRAFGTPASPDRCVYLWGEKGSGRSHLLAAWHAEHQASAAHHVLDDVEALDDESQVAAFNLHNAARAGEAWLLVAGSSPVPSLALREDLKSRLAWGLSFEVLPLTDEEKRAALAAHAVSRGMPMPADLLDYLLTRAPRDMPTLIALVDALDEHSLQVKRPPTLPLLRELLNQNRTLPL